MLTTKLEELILKGRAFFRTAVIAGTQKATINIDDDRFIIITDVTYFPGFYVPSTAPDTYPSELSDFTSQFMIYGNRGFNNFVARTKLDFIGKTLQGNQVYVPTNHIRYDLYLLHTDQVGFSFTKGGDITPTNFVAPANNPGYAPPMDYGRVGDAGALPTSSTTPITTPTGRLVNNTTRPGSGTNNAETFILPVDGQTRILATEMHNTNNYPILHVNYVEILGLPNNLGI
tara:strand:- start:521 stop:1210 length:690 start_codon:yes stop_codon:yes gene_type:complete